MNVTIQTSAIQLLGEAGLIAGDLTVALGGGGVTTPNNTSSLNRVIGSWEGFYISVIQITISNTVFQVSHSRTSPRTLWAAQRD